MTLNFLQVDLASKLQEDPLVAIKKRADENRRQFLSNPVQMQKLQKALKAQKKKKKKGKADNSDNESDRDINLKLASKLALLKDASLPLTKHKKKKHNDLNTILIHKYNTLKSQLSQEDLSDILAGKIDTSSSDTGTESEEESNIKRNKDVKVKKKKNKDKRSDRGDSDHDRKQKIRSDKRFVDDRNRHSRETRESEANERYRDKQGRSRERRSDRTHNKRSSERDAERHHTKQNRRHSSSSENEEPITKGDQSSDDSEGRPKHIKNYGLVRADGTKISLSKRSTSTTKVNTKTSDSQKEADKLPLRQQRTRLTDEEKERRRREMMKNAEWRDEERVNNVRRYREQDMADSKSQKHKSYDTEFLKKELLKSANSSTIESRIKSNMNNIQRSHSDMNRHFSRR